MMLEEEKDFIRVACIANMELNAKTIPYIVTRTMDKSSKVRLEVYRCLKNKATISFMELNILDRLQLILNGL